MRDIKTTIVKAIGLLKKGMWKILPRKKEAPNNLTSNTGNIYLKEVQKIVLLGTAHLFKVVDCFIAYPSAQVINVKPCLHTETRTLR